MHQNSLNAAKKSNKTFTTYSNMETTAQKNQWKIGKT